MSAVQSAGRAKRVRIRFKLFDRMDVFLIDHPRIVAFVLIASLAAVGALLTLLVTR